MTDDKFLQQDEVDELLKAENLAIPEGEPVMPDESITPAEADALGEIGNICMGSAATTLSQLLNKKVLITSPVVGTTNKKDFLSAFTMPFLVIKIKFKAGFDGYNVLIIKQDDAIVMSNLMMGGDGTDLPEEITDLEISAASEAMNQMMGAASTSLADLLDKNINIAPPETELVQDITKVHIDLPFNNPIVVISFNMNIEDLLDTKIMQVIDLNTAREQSKLLWKSFSGFDEDGQTGTAEEELPLHSAEPEPAAVMPESVSEPQLEDSFFETEAPQMEFGATANAVQQQQQPNQMPGNNGRSNTPQVDQNKLNLLLDIPLKVSVVLGRTKKQIKDVLQMTPGAIVELETLVGEPVEILVNGKLVARGEVVVVNENFGVRISNIISTRDRINTINSSNLA